MRRPLRILGALRVLRATGPAVVCPRTRRLAGRPPAPGLGGCAGPVPAMPDLTAIGAWLRQQREALQLSRPALAARSHCAAATIKKIEEGQRSPSPELADHLVRALQIPAAAHPV